MGETAITETGESAPPEAPPGAARLAELIRANRAAIAAELRRRLGDPSVSPYHAFMWTDEGKRRVDVWWDLVAEGVGGRPGPFLADMRQTGYERARQGFALDFIVSFYRYALQIVQEVAERAGGDCASAGVLCGLSDLLLEGLRRVTASYLRTREELNATLLDQVERARREMQRLASETIAIQEEERRRVAGDIHDTITQSLTALGYELQVCCETLVAGKPEQVSERLSVLLERVHEALRESRSLIAGLRPDMLETLGLVPALRHHFAAFERDTTVHVEARLPERLELPQDVNLCLFRVVQEALANVHKHAGVRRAIVELERTDAGVRVSIVDEGRGFAPAGPAGGGERDDRRFGLLIMRERLWSVGGELEIDAAPGRGCRVLARVPGGRSS